LVRQPDGWFLELTLATGWAGEQTRQLVTTELLGPTAIAQLPYVTADDSPLRVDTDYSGKPRNPANPSPGPFENPGTGRLKIKVR
jgi:hypothetical protein